MCHNRSNAANAMVRSTLVTTQAVTQRIDERDWSKLTFGEQVRQLELEGYLVLPNLLTSEQIAALKAQTHELETKGTDYSERQRTRGKIQFIGGVITELAANPK